MWQPSSRSNARVNEDGPALKIRDGYIICGQQRLCMQTLSMYVTCVGLEVEIDM